MEKKLYLFMGVAILVGGFQLIISHQSKKISTVTQCSDGGCTCGSGNDRDDRSTRN